MANILIGCFAGFACFAVSRFVCHPAFRLFVRCVVLRKSMTTRDRIYLRNLNRR